MGAAADEIRQMVADWQDEPWILAVVRGAGADRWNAETAVELAQAVGERRRPALLANLSPENEVLDIAFDAEREAGLADVLAGEGTFADVARKGPGQSFAYLPAGEAADRPEELLRSPRMARLAEQVRQAGGALLVVIPRDAVEAMHTTSWLDGYVAFAPEASTATFQGEVPAYGRLEPPADAPAEGEEAPGRWRRHRDRKPFPYGKIAAGAALLLVLAGGWWWFAQRSAVDGGDSSAGGRAGWKSEVGGGGASSGSAAGEEAAAGAAAGTASATGGDERTARAGADTARAAASGEATGAETGGAAPDEEPASEAAADAGAEAPYSVLMASYASAADAAEAVRRLSSELDVTFFVAPTPVQESLYHRVFAGARPDTASAGRLMSRLVEAGVKDRARAWDVRPVPWAFELGRYTRRDAAQARREELASRGLPAYVLTAAADGDTVHRVYAGAYEGREAAAPLRQRLEEAGEPAELARRRVGP